MWLLPALQTGHNDNGEINQNFLVVVNWKHNTTWNCNTETNRDKIGAFSVILNQMQTVYELLKVHSF